MNEPPKPTGAPTPPSGTRRAQYAELSSEEISFPAMEAKEKAEAEKAENERVKQLPPNRRPLPQVDLTKEPTTPSTPSNYRRPRKQEVSAATVTPLMSSKTWIKLVSLAGFAVTAFVVIQGLMMFTKKSVPDGPSSTTFGLLGLIIIAIGYFFCAVPSFKIWGMASVIPNLEASRDEHDLNEILDRLRALWKYLGILVFVGAGLVLIYIIATHGNKLTGL